MAGNDAFRKTLFVMLEETFESRDKGGNYYLDKSTGWFPTIDPLSAEQASHRLVPGGTTIAGHTFHTTFYLGVVARDLTGEAGGRVDWSESWTVTAVDEEEWRELRQRLRAAYERTVSLLESVEEWGEDQVDAGMASVTHSAFHLGAIRQFLTALRNVPGK